MAKRTGTVSKRNSETYKDNKLLKALYPTHNELIQKTEPYTFKPCLKCGIEFSSNNKGNRLCGTCAAQNQRSSKRAEDGLF